MTEIIQYAPVYIPTLNRYEHFKRCLDSLERCTGANKTDVYVGLDYPPSEKYVEGWKKIDAYLVEKEKSNGFRNLFVRRRDHNCGIGKPGSNGSLLLEEIKKVSDRYIASEDDNEFSPNFLEYINWGLELFKDDQSIYAICGFKRVKVDFLQNNVYKYPRYNAWGIGTWFDRREKYKKISNLRVLKEQFLDQYPLSILFSKKVLYPASIISMLAENSIYGDAIIKFLPEDEQFCVFPKESMVRNWGQDGLGLHGGTKKASQYYSNLPIDISTSFQPIIKDELYQPQLETVYHATYPISSKQRIRAIISFLTYKITGRVLYHKYKDPWYKVTLKKVR